MLHGWKLNKIGLDGWKSPFEVCVSLAIDIWANQQKITQLTRGRTTRISAKAGLLGFYYSRSLLGFH